LSGAPPASIVAWLRGHEAVVSVTLDERRSLTHIVLREPHALAGLARTLKDRLFARVFPPKSRFEARIVHALPGRIRLGVTGLAAEELLRLAEWVRGRSGVERVRPSPASDSILIWFDRAKTTGTEIERD